jgi:hypothetical protein
MEQPGFRRRSSDTAFNRSLGIPGAEAWQTSQR